MNFKKEPTTYGYEVGKISLKAQTVAFCRYAATEPEYHNPDVLFFIDGRPDALPLYEALIDRIRRYRSYDQGAEKPAQLL